MVTVWWRRWKRSLKKVRWWCKSRLSGNMMVEVEERVSNRWLESGGEDLCGLVWLGRKNRSLFTF